MSAGITIRAEVPVIDQQRFSQAIDTELKKLMIECAIKFLIAATRRIPIRTGFLRGSFANLEEATGTGSPSQQIALRRLRTQLRRASSKAPLEYYYPTRGSKSRVLKNPATGRDFSTEPKLILTSVGASYVFTFDVNINYLAINDLRQGWRSWASAIDAFNRHFVANLPNRLPSIWDFVSKDVIIS